jgi:uncharacterized membrane protein
MATLSVLKFNDPTEQTGCSSPCRASRSRWFALTSGATAPDRVIDELRQYDFEIISTNLPEEQEKQLREAFAQE